MKSFVPYRVFTVVIALLFLACSTASAAPDKDTPVSVHTLRCEMLTNPEGIDVTTPRLSWMLSGSMRGLNQVAYQVIVASTAEKLAADEGDLWNSGKVTSDQSVWIPYGGTEIKSRQHCYWKVKVWTNTPGDNGTWSTPAYWSMGLRANDWQARWIGLDRFFPWDSAEHQFARLSARYFRKEFSIAKPVKRAMVYIAGLGLYTLHINGHRVGDQVLAPPPTDYTESVKYNTFDITTLLQAGGNAVGTALGNGRFFTMRQAYKPQKIHTFGYPKMLLQLEIEYTDGTLETVVSDTSWKVTANGPIRTNNEYDGEEYDATKELGPWSSPGYTPKDWLTAEPVKEPGGKVRAQRNEPMKVMQTITPVAIKLLKPGVYIADMGQNMAGWVRLHVKGQRGQTVTLRFAETLQPNGELYTANLRDAKVTDRYTLKGDGEETWEPSFVYHGFRYVEISGFPGELQAGNLEGRVVYDALATTGSFECSNPVLNQIYTNAYWGIRSNYKGMPVDCPQRNERQPWLGDRTTGAYGESFIFDNDKLYAKWLDDIEQSQTAEGRIPDVAPNFWFYYKDNMTWAGAYLTIADMLYRQYGNLGPIADHYPSMKQWLVFMQARYSKGNLMLKDTYGDWCVPPESLELIHSRDSSRNTDGTLIATAYHYYFLGLMNHFATLLNKPRDAAEYAALADKVKTAFQNKFYNSATAQYDNNTITANLLPLYFGITPPQERSRVFRNIVDKIDANHGHISTGVVGTQWLMRSLTAEGRADLAYTMATTTEYPGWGYMVKQGATTIWELWNGNTANPAMNSQNHVMLLGDLIIWLYEDLAGISTSPQQPGFKMIEMSPSLAGNLTSVKASYISAYGSITSSWTRQGDTFTWRITVPPNSSAVATIPGVQVRENGKRLAAAEGVTEIGGDNKTIVTIGSGDYVFTSRIGRQ